MSYPRHSCWKQYKTLFCSSKKKHTAQNIQIYRFNNKERKDLAPQTQLMMHTMPLSKAAGLIVNTYIYGSDENPLISYWSVQSEVACKWDTAYIHVMQRLFEWINRVESRSKVV